jgi:hypothetical protein
MTRYLASVAVLLAAVSLVGAQTLPGGPVVLTVSPAPLPKPAVQYRLLPAGRDLVPGNAAALYYRTLGTIAENRSLYDELKSGPWDTWLTLPLDELPLAEVAARLETVQSLLRAFDEAARRRQCDWQLGNRAEGFTLLLPEVQGLREAARILAVRARCAIAQGRYAEAVRALQAGYALGWHLGQESPLIHVLVGAAITHIMDRVLEELIARPGAPNLYWALTMLPRPYFTLEPSLDQEHSLLERTWPGLRQLEEGPMTARQVQELRQDVGRFWRRLGLVPPTTLDLAAQVWLQEQTYPQARRALLEEGVPAEQLDAMLLYQVVALHALREYRRAWDDYTKWARVADFDQAPAFAKDRERMEQAAERLQRLVVYPRAVPPGQLLIGVRFEKVAVAVGRTDRRFAALRVVEALRVYAAAHEGRLPASLQDIIEVPVPFDPVTNKPFEYKAHGDRARLAAPRVTGEAAGVWSFQSVYELTLRR